MSSEQRRSEFCSSAGNISAASKVIKKFGTFSLRQPAIVLTRQERHWGGGGELLTNILRIKCCTVQRRHQRMVVVVVTTGGGGGGIVCYSWSGYL